ELEIGGHDPDDGVVHAVELEALTDDGGVGGEAPAPESVTEDDGRRASVLSFLIEEPAARRRAHTHDVEERWRDAGAIDALRAVAGQHVVAPESEAGELHTVAFAAPVEKVGDRAARARPPSRRIGGPYLRQPRCIRVWQRLDEVRVERGED